MNKKEFYYLSKDGETRIHAVEWKPEGEVKAVLQLCHGMVEYIERYHRFGEYMSRQGYYVVGHDHLGHGESVTSPEKLGFFHEEHGNEYVIGDIHQLRIQTEDKYPNVPYFMLGHSMGSFLLRQYLGIYGEGLAGAVIMGTGNQSNLILEAGKLLCKVIANFKGWNYRSKLVNNLAFGGYNKKFENEMNGSTWISKNPENAIRYGKDPLCQYMFTVNAYYHMFCGIQKANTYEQKKRLPEEFPVFFVSGEDDPVGNYGKDVSYLADKYRKNGMKDVGLKLYVGDRHEILNEADREMVYQDINAWIERVIL